MTDSDSLDPEVPGELAGGYLAVAVHQHDQRLPALVLHDQRLDYHALVHTQLAAAHRGTSARLVGVAVVGKHHAASPQYAHRRSDRDLLARHMPDAISAQ